MDTIGVYMPNWLYNADKTDRLFWDEFVWTIKQSGRYMPVRVDLRGLLFASPEAAREYCKRKKIVLVVQHDSTYYSQNSLYRRNVRFLESCVPILNPRIAHEIGHDKAETKRILRKNGIPVLDDFLVTSLEELHSVLEEGKWYVIKPTKEGAGTGVKLIRKQNGALLRYRDGSWRAYAFQERRRPNGQTVLQAHDTFLGALTYDPMLVEPYFNDDPEGFSSLRCTVVGNRVVEAVKRTNRANITSNISSGGIAIECILTDEQQEMAIAAKNAIGASYAGVDLLVSGNKSVIGEVNIGPFTVFQKYTHKPVGKLLAEHVMNSSDRLGTVDN